MIGQLATSLTLAQDDDFFTIPSDFGTSVVDSIVAIVLFAIVGVILMFIGFYAIDFTTPGKLSELVRTGKPNAVLVTASGMLSMAFIIVVAIATADTHATGLLTSLIYGLIGIIAQVLAVRLLEWITRLDIGHTIQEDKFAPSSVVVAAVHLALGLIVAVAIS